MSGQQKIEIIVNSKGEASVETKGFTGSSCRDASRLLERALGNATSDRLTSEFYESQGLRQQNTSRG